MIPDGWSEHFLGDVCKISSGVGFPLKFQGRKDLPIPFIKVSDMNSEGNEKYVCSANNTIDSQIQEYVKAPIFPKGCLILPKVGAALLTNKRRILEQPTAVDNNVMVLMSKSVNYEFLYYWSLLIDMADYVQSGALPSINKSTISQIQITLPPEKEQKKIATILSSVDDAIQATQAVIDQTRRVKQGLMQQLLTRGIGHTRFKQIEIGEIPDEWGVVSYSNILKKNMPPIDMKDDELYGPVIVRRRHNGIEVREQKLGINILVKNQFAAVPGTFLISKRQIIHGSSGIVPADIGDNAIISKEYIALNATEKLDIRYLKYLARTPIFHKSVVKTTYGVDDEKFVFKDEWWLKEKMPLPPIEEQKKICDILDSNKNFMDCEEKRLKRLLAVKKGLM